MSDWFMRTRCLIRHVVYCDLVSGVLTGKILHLVWILQQVMRKSRTQVCSRDVSLSLESSLCLFLYLLDSALCVTSSLMSLTPSLISLLRCFSESLLKIPPRLHDEKYTRVDTQAKISLGWQSTVRCVGYFLLLLLYWIPHPNSSKLFIWFALWNICALTFYALFLFFYGLHLIFNSRVRKWFNINSLLLSITWKAWVGM